MPSTINEIILKYMINCCINSLRTDTSYSGAKDFFTRKRGSFTTALQRPVIHDYYGTYRRTYDSPKLSRDVALFSARHITSLRGIIKYQNSEQ